MGFRKKVFYEIGGYEDLKKFSSGDDELLMQKIFKLTSYKIKFCFDPDALVNTNPSRGLREFFRQRGRWASKGLFYDNKLLVIRLILIYLFFLSIPLFLIASIWGGILYLFLFLYSILAKMIIDYSVMRKGVDLYGRDSLRFFLPAQIFHIPYILYSAFRGLFGNFSWKGRRVKR
jgi:cellulose synthase/poly-beta-1,6-N-acetylglucosamine synthase-like glycosyltransferase